MKNSTLVIGSVEEFSSNNVFYNGIGVNGIAAPGSTSNIDLQMQDDNFLTGGQLNVKNASFGDTVNLQVVDQDSVLATTQVPGQPTGVTYSMIPGYPVLRQFATNIQIMDQNEKQETFDLPYPAKVLWGLYLRVSYTSIGTAPALVEINYDLHKALY